MKKTFCSLLAAMMVFFSFFSDGNLTYAKGDISAPLLATEIDDKVLAKTVLLGQTPRDCFFMPWG